MAQFEWKEAESLHVGSALAMINRAELENGNVFHSIRISRVNIDTETGEPEIGAKPTQYLRPGDMDDLRELAQKVKYWVQADIDEIRNRKPNTLKGKKKGANEESV